MHERGIKRSGASFHHAISDWRRKYLALCASLDPWALDETLTAFSSASLEDLQPSRLLQTSEDEYLGGGHDK